MSRPSLYTAEVVDSICARLSTGEPMAEICRDEGMPAARTVRDWMKERPEVSAAIACAREEGFDAIAVKARETARGKGESTSDVQRDKLIVDLDLKLLAKWDPKRYGDRTTLAGDPDAPLVGLTDEQIDAKLAAFGVKFDG